MLNIIIFLMYQTKMFNQNIQKDSLIIILYIIFLNYLKIFILHKYLINYIYFIYTHHFII